jgi:coiled-coil domain-containing protein 55
MAKQYGLIVPNKNKEKVGIQRPSVFDDSDSDEVSVPTGLKKTLKKQDKITQHKAIEEDPTVYQYDEIYDEMDKKRKESKLSRKDLDKKPKYISRLLAAADRRKRENERRIERQVQKERETEGNEFKDKEAFVTSSYKKKLEEMREMEEEEKREEYLESIGDVRKQGNLDGFYRHLYDQKVNYDDKTNKESESVKEAQDTEDTNKTNVRKYRKRRDSDRSDNEEETEVKKEHLPSNLDADSDFSIDSSDSEDENDEGVKETDKAPIIPESEIKQEKIPEETKDVVLKEEEEEKPECKKPKIDIWKKRTVGEVFDAALQRYFERKAQREL